MSPNVLLENQLIFIDTELKFCILDGKQLFIMSLITPLIKNKNLLNNYLFKNNVKVTVPSQNIFLYQTIITGSQKFSQFFLIYKYKENYFP